MNKIAYYTGYMEKEAFLVPATAAAIGGYQGSKKDSGWSGAFGAGGGAYVGGKLGKIPGQILEQFNPAAGKALKTVGGIAGTFGGGVGGYKLMTPSDEEVAEAKMKKLQELRRRMLTK